MAAGIYTCSCLGSWEKIWGAGRKASGKKGTVRGWPDTRALFDPEKKSVNIAKIGRFVTISCKKQQFPNQITQKSVVWFVFHTKMRGDLMPDEGRNIEEQQVTTTELARVLGVTARRVQQLTQDGTFVTVKRGHFLLCDNVQRYQQFISGAQMTEEEKKVEKARKAAEVKIKMAKADIAQLEADELKGNMHRSEDVAAITENMVMRIRSMLQALPGRLAVQCATAETTEECSVIIRDGVHAVMNELTKYAYDPAEYEKRVRERRDWAERSQEAVDDDE